MVVNTYKEKKRKDFYYSITFLVLTILLTLGLFFYNTSIEKSNMKLKSDIDTKSLEVGKLKEIKEVIVYELLSDTDNKSLLESMSYKSQITKFMEHLYTVERLAKLNFYGFNYSGGTISLDVKSKGDKEKRRYNDNQNTNGEEGSYSKRKVNYMKIVDFLNWYKKDYKGALFNIEKIRQFTGGDDIKFSVVFSLK